MNLQSLIFTASRQVSIQESKFPVLAPQQVLVQTLRSAISAGTELLVYRGEAPTELAADESIAALSGSLHFPLKYGYCAVGRVVACGAQVESTWHDRLVFAFNPHETFFAAEPNSLIALPSDLEIDDAVFLPNMETAISFLHDAAPLLGERAVVVGQGVVGLLTTSLLARLSLASLVTWDCYELRRQFSLACGAMQSLDPAHADLKKPGTADVTFELSGVPAALDLALAVTGFSGRVIIGSWYGNKRASLNLGGQFHRSRIKLISSQVSTLPPELSGRWTKARRFELVLNLLRELKPSRLITHRYNFVHAAQAYQMLDTQAVEALQVVLEY